MHLIQPNLQQSNSPDDAGWSRLRLTLVGLTLALVVVALYAPAIRFQFLNFDDDVYVTANAHVSTGLTADNIRWAFTNTSQAGLWHPLAWLSHMVDVSTYGLNPAGHHATSILLHALNAALLFLLLSWMTGSPWRSLVVAALFALHPMNIENVAWVTERKSLLSALFSLLTIAAYVRYAQRPRVARYLLVLVAFALALMAKPMAVTLPVLLLLLDWWPLQRVGGNLGRLIAEKIPILVLSAAAAVVAMMSQSQAGAVSSNPLWIRATHAVWSYGAYLLKIVAPSNLAILHPYEGAPDPPWQVVLAFLVLVVVAAVCVWRRSERYLASGFLFFVLGLLPVAGLVQVGHTAICDRFVYVPAIGLFVAAVWGGAALLDHVGVSRAAQAAIAAAIVLGMAAATATNLPHWRNSYTVFAQAARVNGLPDPVIENNLAKGLSELGRLEEAESHYRKSIELKPYFPPTHYNLGNTLLALGDANGAITELQTALRLSKEQDVTLHCLHNLGAAYARAGDWENADKSYTAALAMAPGNSMTLMGRGYVRLQQRRVDEAMEDLAASIRQSPSATAYHLMGKALASRGDRQQAMAAQREALALAQGMREASQELERLESETHRGAVHQPGLTHETKSVK